MQTSDIQTSAAAFGACWQWREYSIYYVKAGESRSDCPPLLLVHGYGGNTDHWRKNVAELSADFEVWAIDLLGFGRSTKAVAGYGGDLWRDQIHDFITEVIGRPAVLAGNSIGGYVTLCVAAQRPQSVAGLVLLNPAGPFTSEQPQAEPSPLQKTIADLGKAALLSPLPSWLLFQYVRQRSMIRKTLLKVYLDASAVTDQLVEDIYRPTEDAGAPQAFAAMFKGPPGEKNDVLLGQMSCPLLMLWGEGDPWVNARSRGAKFRQYYPSLTEFYLQAGHCPHDEVPGQVDELIKQWVLGLAVAAK
jgi:pimeloyl-ACP methyl ester carboxylesterase